jgi:hypothetical protein
VLERETTIVHAPEGLCTAGSGGYAMLQAANGFQWSNDPDESITWMIRFFDAGLTAGLVLSGWRPR